MTEAQRIESLFPGLQPTEYAIASPVDIDYNCIAWAAGDDTSWWWPLRSFWGPGLMGGYYWPEGLPLIATLANFVLAFERLGYRECPSALLELGWEKVALYANASGLPKHAARQLENGRWISKLGDLNDIEHDTLEGVSGDAYGTVAVLMRRPRT